MYHISNNYKNITLTYGNPDIYIKAINKEGEAYPTKYDDFFPYADNPNAFWTGYFSSRVSMKVI
jgi:hypothetical protein